MRKWASKVLFSKKVTVTLASFLFSMLAAQGLDLPPDIKAAIVALILAAGGWFVREQAKTDTATNGRTSASYVAEASDVALESIIKELEDRKKGKFK